MLKWLKKRKTPESIPTTWSRFIAGNSRYRWTHPDGRHRAYLIVRTDGLFTCGSEYYSDVDFEHCWIPEGVGGSLYDSEETATRELLLMFPWARDVQREERRDDRPDG
jgi:hypothetical protein